MMVRPLSLDLRTRIVTALNDGMTVRAAAARFGDLDPIEMMFAKLKTLVRKADERAVETTWRRIGELLKAFSPQECSNYLRHAGYGSK
ncbi:transposase [Rhizobium leguminosarum]|uniref:hypothetical protein n=1 Tax=Rhizobium leguminosarum TaxID=384 RepID=UPI001AE42F72|nr:hypothetical protein [Rhizobium leguminosarum]MBP2490863.1 transposase [Rhizobium leguminosarum]